MNLHQAPGSAAAADAETPEAALQGIRICFLSSMHPAFDKRVFDKEAMSVVRAGYLVTHLCYGPEEPQIRDGIVIDIEPRRKGLVARAASLVQLYRRAKAIDADIYHCNEVDSWLVGVFLKLIRRKKIIFDVHEHYPANFAEIHFARPLRPLVRFLVRGFMRALTPFTDHLIFAKRSVAPDFPGAKNKHTFVFNNISTEHKDVAPEGTEEGIRALYDGKITAVHTGLYNRARGWPQLLKAMSLMRNSQMEVLYLGTLNDGSEDDFKAAVRKYGLEERVHCLGWKPFKEAYQHVVNCQIGLLTFQPVRTNYFFAYPHKLFDYMLAGMPVIAPEFAWEVKEIVKEAECGLLVDTADPGALAAALDSLIDDTGQARRMGANGRRAVLEKHNWENEAEKLLETYRALLEPSAKSVG